MYTSVPADPPGTPEEIAANEATHNYDWNYSRCINCDCRPWGTIAKWPCGADVPRVSLVSS